MRIRIRNLLVFASCFFSNPKGGLFGKKADSTMALTTTSKVITTDPKKELHELGAPLKVAGSLCLFK